MSTVGAIFLATPFYGTDAARPASWLAVIKGIMGEQASDQLIQDLDNHYAFVRDRVLKFASIINSDDIRLPTSYFFETRKTNLASKILPKGIAKISSRGKIVGLYNITQKLQANVHSL